MAAFLTMVGLTALLSFAVMAWIVAVEREQEREQD